MKSNERASEVEATAARYRNFATLEARERSPRHEEFALGVGGDPEILELLLEEDLPLVLGPEPSAPLRGLFLSHRSPPSRVYSTPIGRVSGGTQMLTDFRGGSETGAVA